MLPGPTFVKTFLRTYAEMLGLDPHVLVEEYRASYEPRDEIETCSRSGRRRWPAATGAAGRRVGPGTVIAARAGGRRGRAGGDRPGAATTTAARATRPRRTETTRPEHEGEDQQPKPAPPRRVSLRITPATPTYVCVDHGSGTPVVFEDTIDAPQTFRGKRAAREPRQDATCSCRMNGKPVKVDARPGSGRVRLHAARRAASSRSASGRARSACVVSGR